MLEKLKNLKNDELFFHKIGLLAGSVIGVLVGFVVSDKADKQDFIYEDLARSEAIEKEMENGEEND